MAALRLELEITTVEPSGDMVFVEGHAPGGVQVGLMIPAASLAARVGQRLAVSLETLDAASAAPSMRERMARGAAVSATTAPPASRAAAGSTPHPTCQCPVRHGQPGIQRAGRDRESKA